MTVRTLRAYPVRNIALRAYPRLWWVLHEPSQLLGLVNEAHKDRTYTVQFGAGGPFKRVFYKTLLSATDDQRKIMEGTKCAA